MAVFPKQSACPGSGVGLKIFSDFSLDDYELPYPLYEVPEKADFGEKYIKDNPGLGLPAMDLSHLGYLFQNFPYHALIQGKAATGTRPEMENAEAEIMTRVHKEEARLGNFPSDRSVPPSATIERAHPLNIHSMKDIHADLSKSTLSFVNKSSSTMGAKVNLKIGDQAGDEQITIQTPGAARSLRDLLKSVDREEDFVDKAYRLQPQISEKEARSEEDQTEAVRKRPIPKEVRAFLDMEAEESGSDTMSASEISSSSQSSCQDIEDDESDYDSERIVPCQLARNVIVSDIESDKSCSPRSTSPSNFTLLPPSTSTYKEISTPPLTTAAVRDIASTVPNSSPSGITSLPSIIENEDMPMSHSTTKTDCVPLSSMMGTVENEQSIFYRHETDSVSSSESLAGAAQEEASVKVTHEEQSKDCDKKCCVKSSKISVSAIPFDNLPKHPEPLCDHCYATPEPQVSHNLALHQFLKWINQNQFYGFVCVAHFGSKFDLPVSLSCL